ncbi:MAG: 3-deoxy-manno-octulosonate cytidylyltransferase [Planctomycetota bacterium]
MRALALVPARLGSRRLARKMLLCETGRYLFQHTVENLRQSGVFERVVLATDAEDVLRAAAEVGVEALATRADHESGTDRVDEAHRLLLARGEGPWDVVVNVQGDEPDLAADDLCALVGAFEDPAVDLATLAVALTDPAELADPASVKVVRDRAGDALYFSRAPIPSASHPDSEPALALRHVGVYAFRPAALARFTSLAPGVLERGERLEQLRWLENGGRLRVVDARHRAFGVDTADDYRRFCSRTS